MSITKILLLLSYTCVYLEQAATIIKHVNQNTPFNVIHSIIMTQTFTEFSKWDVLIRIHEEKYLVTWTCKATTPTRDLLRSLMLAQSTERAVKEMWKTTPILKRASQTWLLATCAGRPCRCMTLSRFHSIQSHGTSWTRCGNGGECFSQALVPPNHTWIHNDYHFHLLIWQNPITLLCFTSDQQAEHYKPKVPKTCDFVLTQRQVVRWRVP